MGGEFFNTDFNEAGDQVGTPFKLRNIYAKPEITPEQLEVMSMQGYLAEQSAKRFTQIIKAVVNHATKREFVQEDLNRIKLFNVEDESGNQVIEYYFDDVLLGTIQHEFNHGPYSYRGEISFVPLKDFDSGEEIVL